MFCLNEMAEVTKKTDNNCPNGEKMNTKDINKRQIAFGRCERFIKWQPIFYFFCSSVRSHFDRHPICFAGFFSLENFISSPRFIWCTGPRIACGCSREFLSLQFSPVPPLITSFALTLHLTISSHSQLFSCCLNYCCCLCNVINSLEVRVYKM